MSRKLLAFLVSELGTVRLICKAPGCGAVAEMPVDLLATRAAFPKCGVCNQPYFGSQPVPDPNNPIARLARAVADLKAHPAGVEVEFVLPDKG